MKAEDVVIGETYRLARVEVTVTGNMLTSSLCWSEGDVLAELSRYGTVDRYRARHFDSHHAAHRAMREAGWSYDARWDYCPECQK